jgi:hypothetical protein
MYIARSRGFQCSVSTREATEGHTARLLNSQGGKLDVLDVRFFIRSWLFVSDLLAI